MKTVSCTVIHLYEQWSVADTVKPVKKEVLLFFLRVTSPPHESAWGRVYSNGWQEANIFSKSFKPLVCLNKYFFGSYLPNNEIYDFIVAYWFLMASCCHLTQL